MTLAEFAARLGLEVSTLRHQIQRGRLKGTKVGPIWTVTKAEADRYEAEVKGRMGKYERRAK